MSNELLTYEHPLNERIRAFLRLEYLFGQINHYLNSPNTWDSRIALECIIEISNILERTDLRHETIKELERQLGTLSRLSTQPAIDKTQLQTITEELELCFNLMHATPGKSSGSLREHEFLNGIRQRLTIPGGTCCFDIPLYHYWLSLNFETRKDHMLTWVKSFKPLKKAVKLILHLIRNSTNPIKAVAHAGQYQKSLQPQTPCQMVRVKIASSLGVYPEISGSKHRVTVRFIKACFNGEKGAQSAEDIPFEITRCTI